MVMVHVRNIRKVFGKGETAVTAVHDISCDVHRGEIVLIMGPSGSGKTTLLTMIGGLLTPTSGTIAIDGLTLTSMKQRELAQVRLQKIGFVFQSFNILQNLSAFENVQIVGDLQGLPPSKSKNRARQLLTKLHMEDRMHARPSQLSGGQQQRVAIARALMNSPQVILADEPTGNLDSKSGHEVMMLFHNIAKEDGRTVIIVSHDERIKDIADRTLWIEDGALHTTQIATASRVPDPVCGMKIEPDYTKFFVDWHGKVYRFCSQDCQEKFSANPDSYRRNRKIQSPR